MVRNFRLHDADVARAEHMHAPPRMELHLSLGHHDPTPAIGRPDALRRAILAGDRGCPREPAREIGMAARWRPLLTPVRGAGPVPC